MSLTIVRSLEEVANDLNDVWDRVEGRSPTDRFIGTKIAKFSYTGRLIIPNEPNWRRMVGGQVYHLTDDQCRVLVPESTVNMLFGEDSSLANVISSSGELLEVEHGRVKLPELVYSGERLVVAGSYAYLMVGPESYFKQLETEGDYLDGFQGL